MIDKKRIAWKTSLTSIAMFLLGVGAYRIAEASNTTEYGMAFGMLLLGIAIMLLRELCNAMIKIKTDDENGGN